MKAVLLTLALWLDFATPWNTTEHHRQGVIWIKEGQGGTVKCSSEKKWRWCYWELTQPSHEMPVPLNPSEDLVAFEGDGMATRGLEGSIDPIDKVFTDELEFTETEDGRVHKKRWETYQSAGNLETKGSGDVTVTFANTDKSCGIHLADVTVDKFQVLYAK